MSVLWVDKVVAVNAANLNQHPRTPSKLGVQIAYGVVRYNGSSWEVSSSFDSTGITTGQLSFSSGDLSISLPAFSGIPIAVASPRFASGLIPNPNTGGGPTVVVQFTDYTGAQVTTATGTMDFTIIIIGV